MGTLVVHLPGGGEPLEIDLPDDRFDKFLAVAEARGCTPSELFEAILAEFIRRRDLEA